MWIPGCGYPHSFVLYLTSVVSPPPAIPAAPMKGPEYILDRARFVKSSVFSLQICHMHCHPPIEARWSRRCAAGSAKADFDFGPPPAWQSAHSFGVGL